MFLNTAISKFVRNEVNRLISHYNVAAWGAPSECHKDVEITANKNLAEIEGELGITFGELRELATNHGYNFERIYNNLVSKILHIENPFK